MYTYRPTARDPATSGCRPVCRSSPALRNDCRSAARSELTLCGHLAMRRQLGPAEIHAVLIYTLFSIVHKDKRNI